MADAFLNRQLHQNTHFDSIKLTFPAAVGVPRQQRGLQGARARTATAKTSTVTTSGSASFPRAAPTDAARSAGVVLRLLTRQRLRWSRGFATKRSNLSIAGAKKRKTSGGTQRDPTRQAAGLRRDHFRPEVFFFFFN